MQASPNHRFQKRDSFWSFLWLYVYTFLELNIIWNEFVLLILSIYFKSDECKLIEQQDDDDERPNECVGNQDDAETFEKNVSVRKVTKKKLMNVCSHNGESHFPFLIWKKKQFNCEIDHRSLHNNPQSINHTLWYEYNHICFMRIQFRYFCYI